MVLVLRVAWPIAAAGTTEKAANITTERVVVVVEIITFIIGDIVAITSRRLSGAHLLIEQIK